VIDLYTILCRHYEEGDRIYGFGFSRGAFTIRILTGLIVSQGLAQAGTESELKRLAQGAFREYRRSSYKRTVFHQFFRWLRDGLIRKWNELTGRKNYDPAEPRARPDIAFLGLWDTVAAYGLPFDELTRAWNFLFPLSFPNRDLSDKVKRACHALALDDERQSFHPLLWNERDEPQKEHIREERLTQVWFAGMHSNVGGSYPDDAMSHVPLDWIMGEAEHAGLIFKAGERDRIKGAADVNGKMYDSRKGLSGAYRYAPRKLDNFNNDPDDSKRKNGEKPNEVIIERPKIHESVFKRIGNRVDGYAPIGLPQQYAVVTAGGDILDFPRPAAYRPVVFEHPAQAKNRANRQEEVWNLVWWKRGFYFLSVAVAVLLAAYPLYGRMTSTGEPWLRFLSPVIAGLAWFLPDFLSPWLSAYQSYPDQFVVLLLSLSVLIFIGTRLQRTIFGRMRLIWKSSLEGTQSPEEAPALPNDFIFRLRSHPRYQRLVKFAKGKVLPPAAGIIVAALLLVGVCRGVFTILDSSGYICAPGSGEFETSNPGWASGQFVEEGKQYQLAVTMTGQWIDDDIVTGLGGFEKPYLYLAVPFRRHISEPWFKSIARIGSKDGDEYPLNHAAPDKQAVAVIKARRSGEIYLFVNDAVLPFPKSWQWFYKNNHGLAKLEVKLLN
ncbi:MAG: phospholipase effector Tle1 domain-containing protein, partial [Blastocatellia bacterium]